MEHGIQAYFDERARCARRVAALSTALGGVLMLALLVALTPSVHRALTGTPVLRFGFEGPPRYVELVQVEAVPGLDEPLVEVGKVVSLPSRAGGGGRPVPGGRPEAAGALQRSRVHGPGESYEDLLTRAQSPRGRLPVFQSEDLVIEHLVRPEYPEDARDRGVEGRVSVLALVDTLGRVVEAQVTQSGGDHQLDVASRQAVLQCRFRPYRVAGRSREVYAEFHFAFRIYY